MSRSAVPFEKKVIQWAETAELSVVRETLAVASYAVKFRDQHEYDGPEEVNPRTTLSERKAARRKVKPDGKPSPAETEASYQSE